VQAAVSQAWALVLVGLVGLVVAPWLGWLFGPRAARREETWARDALAIVLLVEASLLPFSVFQTLVRGTDLDPVALLGSIVYSAVVIFPYWASILTCVVIVPMGIVWARIVRWVAARQGIHLDTKVSGATGPE
jgi:hypothetical protein